MKNMCKIVILLVFTPVFGMEDSALPEFIKIDYSTPTKSPMYASPAELIKGHIEFPKFIKNQFKKYNQEDLLNFRDERYNNLLHLTVRALIQKKETPDVDELIHEYQPVLARLVELGIDINEMNDDHDTPIFLVYDERDEKLAPLEKFLEFDLGAHPTHTSLMPEVRLCIKTVRKIFFCC